MTTFRVSAVERDAARLATVDTRRAIAALLGRDVAIEACTPGSLVAEAVRGGRWHPFVAAADAAFNGHLPLVLSPDAIWLCIGQGLAAALRTAARADDRERETIAIRRDDWMRGDPDNPWPSIFDDFVRELGARRPEVVELITPTFSTTTAVERAAYAVTVMDALQDHYRYVGTSLCGIPEMTLLGTPDDYQAIAARIDRLADHGLAWWVPSLAMVCRRLVAAAEGRPDVDFFRSFYKRDSSSGGPHMNGWINVLFPFERDDASGMFSVRNPHAERWEWPVLDDERQHAWEGARPQELPLGLSRAPLLWKVLVPPGEYRYELLAGFVGVSQDPASGALRPEIGWAVREA
jgi:hypothetical protein